MFALPKRLTVVFSSTEESGRRCWQYHYHKKLFRCALLTLFCISVGLLPPTHTALAQEKLLSSAEALLGETTRRMEDMYTLYARFTQEKSLSILNTPLVSTGYLCMERGAGSESLAGRIFWAYETPLSSGFAYEKGHFFLWTGDHRVRRSAQGMEAVALKAVAEHILAFMRMQPESLDKLYRMERLPDRDGCPVLRLVPRQRGSMFAALEVTLAPGRNTLHALRFEEISGDSVYLRFSDVRVNAILPPVCRNSHP